MPLTLTRKPGESIRIGPDILVTVKEFGHGGARISIAAPDDVVILRDEVVDRMRLMEKVLAEEFSTAASQRSPDGVIGITDEPD